MNALATTQTSSSTSTTAPATSTAPGKSTASSGLPPDAAGAPVVGAGGPLPAPLAKHVGETFVDGGSFVWRIEGDGGFVCVAQPPGAKVNSVGARVTASKSADLWQKLCGMALTALEPAALPAPANDGAPASPATPAPEPASGGFSLDAFLSGLVAIGQPLVDIGSQAAGLVSGAVDGLVDTLGALLGFGDAAPAAPAAGSPSEDAGDGDVGAVPAPVAPAPVAPEPAVPAPSDKKKSGAEWRSIADSNGWESSKDLGKLVGDFGSATSKFIDGLRASGAAVEINCTFRHENRAYLMHYAWTLDSGEETPALANSDCESKGIAIEWDHGDAEMTKQAAAALKKTFNLVAKPSLGTLHKTGEAIDMKITGVPAQLTVDGKAYDAEPKTQGKLDEDKVDHIGRDLGVIWYGGGDYVHWSVNGR